MSRNQSAYWFVSGTMERCTAQINALRERGLIVTGGQFRETLESITPEGRAYIAANPYEIKSETWWHLQLSGPSIAPIKVGKATADFVTINGRRTARYSDWESYHSTRGEAAKVLVKHAESMVRGAESRLESARNDLVRAKEIAAS